MDSCLSHQGSLPFLPPRRKSVRRIGVDCALPRRKMVVVAVTRPSLDAPLVPRSAQGRFLSSVLLQKRQLFHFAVADLLKQLAQDKEAALSRMFLSSGSHEASLHRRIAQLKESYCQTAVEDIMYMLILYKFSEIRVPLVPKLPTCIYNGRLDIWPSNHWELESIHTCDVLELIKQHTNAVIGLRLNSTFTDDWATNKHHLSKLYTASILYGYFLKSASLRHQLECSLCQQHHGSPLTKQLRHYISGLDPNILQRCAKPRSCEAKNLIAKQSLALFGPTETQESVVTSFSSLKRLLLEAVAFGTFLWDTEEYVDGAFELNENENAEEEENSSV